MSVSLMKLRICCESVFFKSSCNERTLKYLFRILSYSLHEIIMCLTINGWWMDGWMDWSRSAALHVIWYALPVPGCHYWFLAYPNKLQCSDQSNRVAWHQKHSYSRWNFVAIMCISWDIRYFLSTSGSRPPSLIFHPPCCRHVLTFVPLYCSLQKLLITLKFHMYSICNVRFKCFRFHVHHFDFRWNTIVTSASSKTNAATLNLLPKGIYGLWFNGHQVHHIFINKSFTLPSLLVT